MKKDSEVAKLSRLQENKKCRITSTHFYYFGRGSRNRTHIDGFGDRSTAFVRYPYHRALLLLHK